MIRFNPFTGKLDIVGEGGSSGADEKVKYDALDPTAGYIADKFKAGSGISLAEGTGADENKLVISSSVSLDGLIKADGTVELTADWDVGAGNALITTKIQAPTGGSITLGGPGTIGGVSVDTLGEVYLNLLTSAGFVKNDALTGKITGGNSILAGDIPSGIDAINIADGSVTNAEFQYINSLSSNAQDQLDGKQPLDATLTSLAGMSADGVLCYKAGADAVFNRTLTGTANQITVGEGTGAAGNPTFSLPTNVYLDDLIATQGNFGFDSSNYIQFSDSGKTYLKAGGTNALYIDADRNLNILGNKELRLNDSPGLNYVGFKTSALLGASTTYTWPDADGSTGQVLGTNGSAVLSWVDLADISGAIVDGYFLANGLMVRTASGSYTSREIKVVANELSVSNPTGQLGDPELGLASSLLFPGTAGFSAGTTINEFSTDGTFAGDSDDAVPTEKAVKTYVDLAVLGLANKTDAVMYLSLGNETIADIYDGETYDGETVNTGDRIAWTARTDPKENGIYVVGATTGTTARSSDANTGAEIENIYFLVTGGTHAGEGWVNNNSSTPTIGVDDLPFVQFLNCTAYSEGTGIDITGSTISLDTVTADRALISNGSGYLSASDITATELGYLDGVSSNIQTQLNLLAPKDAPTFTSSVTIPETACATDTDKFVVLDTGVLKYRTGAQLLSDIGGAPTGDYLTDTDFVSGNGIMVRTAAGSYTTRTIYGTTNEVLVAHGVGDDDITISLPDVVYLGASGQLGRDADNLIDFTTDNEIGFKTSGHATNDAKFDSDGNLDLLSSNSLKFTAGDGKKVTLTPALLGGTDYELVWPTYDAGYASKTVLEIGAGGAMSFARQQETKQVTIFNDDTVVITDSGAGSVTWTVPSWMDGWEWRSIEAQLTVASTSGDVSVQIYNLSTSSNALSSPAVASALTYTGTGTVNPANQTLTAGHRYRFDTTYAGSTAMGLVMAFQLLKA